VVSGPFVTADCFGATKKVLTDGLNMCYITPMQKAETLKDVRRWFSSAIQKLWPVALGSISLRKSPCIRENCSACASGKGHSSYALSGYRGDRRFSIYVPDKLVPEVQKAIENGRRLQDLIKEAGARYLRAQKREGRSRLRK
jgi:uncharacterized protein DUF6788